MAERTVFVCGAGLMGHGIAQVLAAAGHRVALYEPDVRAPRPAASGSRGNLARAVAKGRLDADESRDAASAGSRSPSRSAAGAADVDLVVEAVFEDETVKRALFGRARSAAPPAAAIFATNTSSISIDSPGRSAVAPERRRRFVGMHFFSPVPVMPLVELIRGAETDDETEADVRELAAELGKQVIVVARPARASSSTGS